MTYDEALSYLLSLGHETLTIKLGLTNTGLLLSALGSPHRQFPAVQIAGTNGKGSVAVTLESICRASRIRSGLFTSPHLVSITERIRTDGQQISESDFARLTTRVRETAAELLRQGQLKTLPTFFEHVTAIALLAFREAKVELAILETGLGGRLDSTTAAGAGIVAITPIAMDHEEYLGHTLAEIAAEKAAIIRLGVTAIIAPQPEDALDVIVRQCEESRVAPLFINGSADNSGRNDTEIVGTSADGRLHVNFTTNADRYRNVLLGLRGRHQIANVATAIALAEALRERGFAIPREAIIRGVETAGHPGRLEFRDGRPRILFDGAHNPASARALRDFLDEFVKEPVTLIFGAMRDKALREMAVMLFPSADAVILTELDNPRAASRALLTEAVPGDFDQSRLFYSSSVDEALCTASKLTPPDGLICVTGSLYLVGAAQEMLKNERRPTVARQKA